MPRISRYKTKLVKALFYILVGSFLLLKMKQFFLESSFERLVASLNRDNLHPGNRDDCSGKEQLDIPLYAAQACIMDKNPNCEKFRCANLLFSRDNNSYAKARDFMMTITKRKVEPEEFVKMTGNCEAFLAQRGFSKKMAMEKDVDFPIAFNILAHGNVEQVERLIYALYRPQNRFCVYFDKKSANGSQEALEAISRCLPNVFPASKRTEIYWGSYSRLEADLVCMKDHLESGKDWKYLINTAGQAFPIRSPGEMVEILKIYNGANDIEGMQGEKVLKSRFEHKFIVNPEGIIAVKEPIEKLPAPPHDLDIVRGSAYGIFSRRFVEFLLTDPIAKDLLEWSRDTFSPDELFFSTLHHTYSNPQIRPPGGYSGKPEEKRWLAVYANWGAEPCSGYQRHGICVFGVEDLPNLISRTEFFVNKFLADFEPMALECLRSWIDYKDFCTGLHLLDRDFYLTLPFIKK